MGYYPILDRAPKGRDEGEDFQTWIHRHDEYETEETDAQAQVGTQEEWKAEREELIKKEKELTRRGDELTSERQELPGCRSRRSTSSRP